MIVLFSWFRVWLGELCCIWLHLPRRNSQAHLLILQMTVTANPQRRRFVGKKAAGGADASDALVAGAICANETFVDVIMLI